MALSELPDDRRAQPRRDVAAPSAPYPPGRAVPAGPRPPAARPPGRPNLAGPRPPGRAPDDRPTDVLPIVEAETPVALRPVDEPVVAGAEPAAALPAEDEPPAGDADAPPVARRRRQLGSSPDERPASSYRVLTAPGRTKPGRRRRPAFWRELPILVVVALVLTFLIQTFLAKVYVIPSGSMETTLHGCTGCTNDRVLVDKMVFRFRDPKPGDVVVFRGPDTWRNSEFTVEETANPLLRGLQALGSLVGLAPPDEKDFVKRVIAVGGQTVSCCDPRNRLLVDGQPLDEPYIYYLPDAGPPRQAPFGPITVPAGSLWMMGDSRNNSADSRIPGHGAVPVADVIGQVRVIVMPFSRVRRIPSIDPHSAAVGLGSGAPDGAPAALGLLAALPVMRRRRALDGFLPGDEFLPGAGRRRRRSPAGGTRRPRTPGGATRFPEAL